MLLDFESVYEKIGMPALVIQIITGLLLFKNIEPNLNNWFNLEQPISHLVLAKLGLLTLTFCFALNARFRVIPNLSEKTLKLMAVHIIFVTFLSVLFVLVGVSFRTGWLY